jgi:hypothetical protein
MCQYTTSPNFYENCRLTGTGWNASPHYITTKIIWQCETPYPDAESGEVCAEKFQTERGEVLGDKVKTKLPGDCPVCRAIEEASVEVFIVSYEEVYP